METRYGQHPELKRQSSEFGGKKLPRVYLSKGLQRRELHEREPRDLSPSLCFFSRVVMSEGEENLGEETTQGHEKIHLSGLKMTVHGRDIGLVKPLFSPVRD